MCNLIKISRQRMVAVAQPPLCAVKLKLRQVSHVGSDSTYLSLPLFMAQPPPTLSYSFLSIWTPKWGLLSTNKTATVFVSQTPFPSDEGSKCEGCAEELLRSSLGGNQANCLNK